MPREGRAPRRHGAARPWHDARPHRGAAARGRARSAGYASDGPDVAAVDWADEAAKREATAAALRRDYGITCEIPADRLCPTLPNRLNYLAWLDALLSASGHEQVRGLDIGTGPIAVYALLACARHPAWRMLGTDVDAGAVAHAQAMLDDPRNAALPFLAHVEVRCTPASPLLPDDDVTFTMCNPPFYASEAERTALRDAKAEWYEPCVAAPTELYTPGGEVAFVTRLVDESARPAHRGRIAWYSSMLGRLTSVRTLVHYLRAQSITNYAVTELVQGRTRRWAIAWSFRAERVPDALAQPASAALRSLAPPSTTRLWPDIHMPAPTLRDALAALPTLPPSAVAWDAGLGATVWSACWTRAARRARQRGAAEAPRRTAPLLQVRWHVGAEGVRVQWMAGHDVVLFDSFCAHVHYELQRYGTADAADGAGAVAADVAADAVASGDAAPAASARR